MLSECKIELMQSETTINGAQNIIVERQRGGEDHGNTSIYEKNSNIKWQQQRKTWMLGME